MDATVCWSPYPGSLCARECSLTAWIMTHWSQRSEELGQHSYIAWVLRHQPESGRVCAFVLQLRWRIDFSSSHGIDWISHLDIPRGHHVAHTDLGLEWCNRPSAFSAHSPPPPVPVRPRLSRLASFHGAGHWTLCLAFLRTLIFFHIFHFYLLYWSLPVTAGNVIPGWGNSLAPSSWVKSETKSLQPIYSLPRSSLRLLKQFLDFQSNSHLCRFWESHSTRGWHTISAFHLG